MRKFLSVMLSLILLFSMAVPVFAATNDSELTETRTVEEILNEYHEKSFAAEMEEKSGNPSVYSRQTCSGKTLEEETVDELRAAGYEAYLVTSSNYEALEESLKTDFAEMGLESNGSYIITISGESSGNTRSVDPPSEDFIDDGGSYFVYTYGGMTYKMRQIIVTTAEDSTLANHNSVVLLAEQTVTSQLLSFTATLLNTAVYTGIDMATSGYWGTLASIIGLGALNFPVGYEAHLALTGSGHWTRKYTQICQTSGAWSSYSSVDYVDATITLTGYYYNTSILDFVHPRESYSFRRYSAHYADSEWQKQQAVLAYTGGYRHNEYVGAVHVYEQKTGDSNPDIMLTVWQP